MEEVTHAHTVRIGPAHKCGVFEADGFVYATILGEGVPSRSRPANKHTRIHVSNNDVLGGEDHGLQGVGLPSAACQRSQRSRCEQTSTMSNTARGNVSVDVGAGGCAPNYRMVSGDKHEPPLAHFVDALCDKDMTVSDEAVGMGGSRSKLTLGKVVRSVPGKLRAGKRKREHRPVIYKLTSPSGKAYVGQTVNARQRFHKHASGKSHCTALAAAIAKYGWARFKKDILVECAEDELDTMEDEMIRKHGTLTPQGYNLIPGGTFNPIQDPATYAKVRAMWDRGEIQAIQRQAWKNPKLRARMKKVHKERCKVDGGRAKRQGIANLENGNATLRSHSDDAMAKRQATWDAKREAKLASMTEDKAAKVRAQTGRKKTSYAEACASAGGADKLREKRREWARLRKERTFLANS